MEFRSVLKTGRKHKIRISHVAFEYNEQTIVQRDISFGGVTFPVVHPGHRGSEVGPVALRLGI